MTLIRKHNGFFPSLFDDFLTREVFDRGLGTYSNGFTLPKVNVKETGDDYQIEVAAPGFKKDDFKIELNNNVLTISSESKDEKEENNDNYSRKEFHYSNFSRSFTLPEGLVNGDKIEAKYNDGILSIVVPKREEVKPKPARMIAIS